MTSQRTPKATCSSCSEPIIWCRTETGKRMPVNVEPIPEGNLVLSPGPLPTVRSVSRAGREPGQRLYVSHFSSCRQADKHRGEGTVRPSAPPVMPQDGLFSEVPR